MKTSTVITRLWRITLVLLLTLVRQTPDAWAADANPPERLTYQGYLADGSGVALGNTAPKNYDVIFRIYDKETLGNIKWAEQQTLTVDKGYYSVLLGEGAQVGNESHLALSTLFVGDGASDRYVEVTVKAVGAGSPAADVIVAPRLRLLTSPYAFSAKQASQIVNKTGTPLLNADATNLTVIGDFVGNGNLKGATLNVTGASTLAAVNSSGNVEAAGNLKGATLNVTGASTVAGVNSSGNVEAAGNLKGATLNVTGASTVASLSASGNVAAASFAGDGSNLKFGGINAPIVFASQPNYGVGIYDKFGEFTSGGWMTVLHGAEAGLLGLRDNSGTLDSQKPRIRWDGPGVAFWSNRGLSASIAEEGLYLYNAYNRAHSVRIVRNESGVYLVLNGAKASPANNTVYFGGGAGWEHWSDRRLKTNIVDAESVLGRVMAVQMRRFQWKGEKPETPPQLGVIAQEFQLLFPELISKHAAPNSNPDSHDELLMLASTGLGPIAIKAIQELKQEKDKELVQLREEKAAEIAELRKEIASLKANAVAARNQADEVTRLVEEMARLKKLVATIEILGKEAGLTGIVAK